MGKVEIKQSTIMIWMIVIGVIFLGIIGVLWMFLGKATMFSPGDVCEREPLQECMDEALNVYNQETVNCGELRDIYDSAQEVICYNHANGVFRESITSCMSVYCSE